MNIRTLSACILINLFSTTLFGQTLYGLKKNVNGSMTIPFDVVNIDPLKVCLLSIAFYKNTDH